MTRPTLQPNPTLLVGSKGEEVRRLQVALNTKYAGLNLRTDGEYDAATAFAINRFQEDSWLITSGEADICTQNALLDAEAYPPIRHDRPFIPQPDPTSCWAACTAMLKRSSVAKVRTATEPGLLDKYGSLKNVSNQSDWLENTASFASFHNLRFRGPTTWPANKFAEMLADGPIMIDTLWNAEYVYGADAEKMGSPGHMTLVVGCRGDGEPSGRGTTLMVYDPWKPGVGNKRRVTYNRWMSEVTTRTYRIFY